MNRHPRSLRTSLLLSIAFVLGAIAFGPMAIGWFYKPPAVQIENLDCIQLLRTACSAQNDRYLAGVKKLIQLRVSEDKMSKQELGFFQKIIDVAETKDWTRADSLCIQFEKAQLSRSR